MIKKIGIEFKITFFIVLVVVTVLSVSTYLSRKLTEEKAEENLRERYINILRQIDASIVTQQELDDAVLLDTELGELIQVRPNIILIEVFKYTPSGIQKIGEEGAPDGFDLAFPPYLNQENIRSGEIITHLVRRGKERYWDIMAPVRVQKEVVGMIRGRFSTKEFDLLVAQDRSNAVFITVLAGLIILLFLTLFLRRTISTPILSLVHAMSQAESGNLWCQATVHSKDELGKLAEQFNRMLQKIREGAEQANNFNEILRSKVEQARSELIQKYEELIETNRQLYQTQRQLAHSQRLAAAGQVVATVAHQVGTPLHSVLGHLNRLKRDPASPKREERIQIIESQVERVVQIIRNLLDSVRYPLPIREPVQLNEVLENLLQLMMPVFTLKGVKVERNFDSHLPPVMGDSGQLQEVFLNLFTNALDAMPDGGTIKIITSLDSKEESNKKVIHVFIKDTGVGISENHLSQIFTPFFTTKDRNKGTGLGLSICQEILKAHKGEILVASPRGKGATLTVTLPIADHDIE